MDSVKKIIYFAVGIILTVGFIAIGMSMFNKSKETISAANAQYDSMIGRYSDIEYAIYDGADVSASGAEVTRLIKELDDGGITIFVRNGAFSKNNGSEDAGVAFNCSSGKFCGYGADKDMIEFTEAIRFMTDKSKSMYYINPNATFKAEVHRNGNGVIDSLIFSQK